MSRETKKTADWTKMTVADVMNRDVISVPASASAREVEQILVESGVSGAPVSDHRGKTVGVVSWRDVMEYFAHSPERDPHHPHDFYRFVDAESQEYRTSFEIPLDDRVTAEDMMNTDLLTVAGDARLAEAAALMCEHRVHRVLVTEGDEVVGIASTMDLLKVLAAGA